MVEDTNAAKKDTNAGNAKPAPDGSTMGHLTALKTVNPIIYYLCMSVLGVAAAAALFRAYGFGNLEDIFVFLGVGVIIYALTNVLLFFTKSEVHRVLFSAIVLILACSVYVWGVYAASTDTRPSGRSSPVLACWLRLASCPQKNNSPPASNVETVRTAADAPANGTIPSPTGKNTVYVQFAGAISRDQMVALNTKLHDAKWNIPDYKRGGERRADAAGLNAIRYYYKADRENAERLAQAVLAAPPPAGAGKNLEIQYFGDRYQPRQGLLELWLSN